MFDFFTKKAFLMLFIFFPNVYYTYDPSSLAADLVGFCHWHCALYKLT